MSAAATALKLIATSYMELATMRSKESAVLEKLAEGFTQLANSGAANLSSAPRAEIDALSGSKRKRGPKPRLPGQPKRPASAYLLFMADRRKHMPAEEHRSPKEVITELGAAWKALSPEEKAPFEASAHALMDKYKRDMEDFKAGRPIAAAEDGDEEEEVEEEEEEAVAASAKRARGGYADEESSEASASSEEEVRPPVKKAAAVPTKPAAPAPAKPASKAAPASAPAVKKPAPKPADSDDTDDSDSDSVPPPKKAAPAVKAAPAPSAKKDKHDKKHKLHKHTGSDDE